jgi:DNA-binding XRE family transcriptional regulator
MAVPPLSAKELQELANKLNEIERLSKKFNENINTVNLQDLENNVGAINTLFESLIKKEQELGAETDYLISSFQELANKIKSSTVGIQESTKALKGLSSIAEQLNSHQKGYNELSAKDLAILQQKSKFEGDRLNRSRDILKNEADALSIQIQQLQRQGASSNEIDKIQKKLDRITHQYEKVNDLLSVNDTTLADINTQLDKELKIQKDIEKQLGVTGAVLKGISKIPFLGDAINTKKALEDATTAVKNGGGAMGGMKAAIKSVGSDIKSSLKDPLVIISFLVTQIISAFKSLDDGIGQFAKGMNVTYQDAAKLNNEFNNIANSSMDVAVTTKGIRDTMLAMGQAMGSNAILNAKDAVTFTKLREQAGLTNDELAEMEKLSLATGTSLEKNVENTLYAAKTTALNNGVLLNEKQIMQEVAKASAATKLSLANNPEALAKAAAQAKALGMNLEQVNSIADKMLDIESSISNELEAELLTGKNLNLEQARLYALNNDMEGLSREIAKNFGSAAEFSKMNRLQQEAAAKAVGMSREELAKTLTDQEALKGLSGKQAEDAKAALEAARARGMSEADIKKQGIEGLMKQQSMQERFNQSIEKLKEIFVSLVAPLMPVLDIFAMILKPVGLIAGIIGKIVGSVTGLVGGLLESKGVLVTIASIVTGLGVAMNYTAIQTGIISAQKKMSLMWDERGLILEKGKAAVQGVQLGYQAAMGSYAAKKAIVEKGGLVRSIGEAAMKAISSLASIPVVGWALGLAAAGTVAALGYKFMQGNDVVSPGGYGKRTLMGPEGAIALNDKDTVIAGTNLFDKKGDDVVSEPGKITTFKKENEIKAPSGGTDMSAIIAKLDALTAAVQSFGTKPVQVAVTMDGKKVAEGLGNHATQLGTSANVGTSKVA